ncbi:hypothetical protein, partial [Klebsiella pneumoniae]
TQFNQRYLGNRAFPTLNTLESNRITFLSNLIRITYEHYFWTQNTTKLPVFVESETLERLDQISVSSDIQAQFLWIERTMPASLTMSIMSSEEFVTLKKMANDVTGYEEKFSQQIEAGTQKANETIETISDRLTKLINKSENSQRDISKYVDKLSEYKSEYNFVLLSKAFSNLLRTKKSECDSNHIHIIIFSSLLIATPLLALFNHIFKWYSVDFNLNAFSYYLPIL